MTIESEATADARQAVREVLDEHGLALIEVRPAYIRESASDILPWLVQITLTAPIAAFLVEAARAAGKAAGDDAWKVFKGLVKKLYERRKETDGHSGSIVIRIDSVEIYLPEHLPDIAFEQLQQLDAIAAPFSGMLKWEEDAGSWVDPLGGTFVCEVPSCTLPATQQRVRQEDNRWTRTLLCDRHGGDADPSMPSR